MGVVALFNGDGTFRTLFREPTVESLLKEMEAAADLPGRLEYFLTLDHPVLAKEAVADLLGRLDHEDIGVREAATGKAIRLGAPMLRALGALKPAERTAEARARLESIRSRLARYDDRITNRGLDHDIPYLAELMEHPELRVRESASARARRVLPDLVIRDAADLRRLWEREKGRYRWDTKTGQYRTQEAAAAR